MTIQSPQGTHSQEKPSPRPHPEPPSQWHSVQWRNKGNRPTQRSNNNQQTDRQQRPKADFQTDVWNRENQTDFCTEKMDLTVPVSTPQSPWPKWRRGALDFLSPMDPPPKRQVVAWSKEWGQTKDILQNWWTLSSTPLSPSLHGQMKTGARPQHPAPGCRQTLTDKLTKGETPSRTISQSVKHSTVGWPS